ncbi:MAG: hypothetical protein J6T01_00140 [Kiritimatiellae bacterium]|nr:hypothetical protein [Kiritimatiellia bacterium]
MIGIPESERLQVTHNAVHTTGCAFDQQAGRLRRVVFVTAAVNLAPAAGVK